MNHNKPRVQCRYQLTGWILFIFSAMFFIATSIRAGDMLGLMGGLFFLAACFVFLVPLLSTDKAAEDIES
jgi:hypothetical protein